MEGTGHKSERILKVERSFVWTRLEDQVMASAYECVVPLIRRSSRPEQLRSGRLITKIGGELRCAAGA